MGLMLLSVRLDEVSAALAESRESLGRFLM